MSRIDYSKWNNIDGGSSDEDNSNKPVVTKLTQGQQVTIGPQGASVESSEEKKMPARSSTSKTASDSSAMNTKSNNEYITPTHKWKQDRYEVLITILLNPFTKASEVKLNIKSDKTFILQAKGAIVLEKVMKYNIESFTDEWEVIGSLGSPERSLFITVKKKSPIPNATIWWSAVFVGDEEIDVTTIPGRSMGSVNKTQEDWAKAQETFLHKMVSTEDDADNA